MTNVFNQASLTVVCFQRPDLAADINLPMPALISGMSPGLGGDSSTFAYFKKLATSAGLGRQVLCTKEY